MFACASNNHVLVYNFYTQMLLFHCKDHYQPVRGIDWLPDDMGFTSCSQEGSVFFYDLAQLRETESRNTEKDFTEKGIGFVGLCNVPGMLYNAVALGNNRRIFRVCDEDVDSKSVQTNCNLSQVKYLDNGRYFLAGAGE